MGEQDTTRLDEPEEPAPRSAPRVRRRPDQTSDDTDRGWGDPPAEEDEHDRWLREQRPPHWE